MKAWLLPSLEGIEELRLEEVAEPKLQPGEVLLDVLYAGLNPADRYLAERQYPAKPSLPHVLGRDGMGAVKEVAAAAGIKVGDKMAILRGEVGISRWGTFAQRVAVPAESLVAIPGGWTEAEAAGATLVYLTAYQAITMWGALRDAVVLVSGASGGVGVAAVQLAKAMGHRVVALSRSDQKRKKLLDMGASMALDPIDPSWTAQLKRMLSPKRVDLAIDNIGGTLLPEMIDTLGENGRVSCVGRLAGPVPQFNTAALLFRRIRIGGVAVGAYTNAESRSAWGEIVRPLLQKIGARPLVDQVFPFDQLPAAFDRLAQGPWGRCC